MTRLAEHRISATGITKAALGSVDIADAFLQAGVTGLGDSRFENKKALRLTGNDLLSIYACCRSDRSIVKLSSPEGEIAQTAFGKAQPVTDRGVVRQAILAIFVQDIDPCGLQALRGIEVLGASYDQLIIESNENDLSVGEEVSFQLNYSARGHVMTSPFVSKTYTSRQEVLQASSFDKNGLQP